MRTLIVYESKHGGTEKCVSKLKENLQGDVIACNLVDGRPPNTELFDNVILGGPVYAGKLPKQLRGYIESHSEELSLRKLGLFVCGMQQGTPAEAELRAAFPDNIYNIAVQKQFFGGALYMEKLNFFERMVAKMVTKSDQSIQWQNGETGQFAERFNLLAVSQMAKSFGGRE